MMFGMDKLSQPSRADSGLLVQAPCCASPCLMQLCRVSEQCRSRVSIELCCSPQPRKLPIT